VVKNVVPSVLLENLISIFAELFSSFLLRVQISLPYNSSNPAEALGFLRAKKSSARLPSEGR
jgi:hypothetical protein